MSGAATALRTPVCKTAATLSGMDYRIRSGTPDDALCISALATQTFLDTYATEGIRPDLAREVFSLCSVAAFAAHLNEAQTVFLLAEHNGHLLGFAQLSTAISKAGNTAHTGCELVRLYVQPNQKRRGIGRALMQAAAERSRAARADSVWLTAWAENHRARAFYAAIGYQDVGELPYVWEDQSYENRVFVRAL
jgi:diamine N-acetyltransferase